MYQGRSSNMHGRGLVSQGMGGGHQAMGGGHQAMGGGHQAMGGGHQAMGGGHQAMGGGQAMMANTLGFTSMQPLQTAVPMMQSSDWSGSTSVDYQHRAGGMYSGEVSSSDQYGSQPMELDNGSDPEQYETSVYIGSNDMPDDFDVRTKLLGEKGENLDYIRRSTGAKVLMKGRGSGVQSNRPLHIFISHSSLKGMEDAEKLAQNLAKVVQEDLEQYFAERERQLEQAPSPARMTDDFRDTGRPWDKPNRDKRVSGGGTGFNNELFTSQSPERNNRFGGRFEGGPDPMIERRNSAPLDYNNTERFANQRIVDHSASRVVVEQPKHCNLCNFTAPNKEMFVTHCNGLMHQQNLRVKTASVPQAAAQGPKLPQRRSAPAIPDSSFRKPGTSRWDGPPSPKRQRKQAVPTPETIEDWVFNCCERILEMQINSTSLRNLRRSVEKIGLRNINSALPARPQTLAYCKLCKLDTDNMPTHLTSNTHGVLYLLRQIQLGDAFIEYYSDVPIPGVITDGGRVLAMDALQFGPCIPETNRERFKELLVYSGAFLSYSCKVCDTKINSLNGWIQHTTSKKHGKAIVAEMIQIGFDAYVDKYKNIPVPPPKNARIIAADTLINQVHFTVPARKAGAGIAATPSLARAQANSTFYEKLSQLNQQDRQLVLQVQVLTGISDINVILTALNALSNMDPGMLKTLCHMDALAVEHAMAGNATLSGMDVVTVQKIIQFYAKFKHGIQVSLPANQGIPRLGFGMAANQPRMRPNEQNRDARDRNRAPRERQDGRNIIRGSRWDSAGGDRDRKGRNDDRTRGRDDRRKRSPEKGDKGGKDGKRGARDRSSSSRVDLKKKNDPKSQGSNKDDKKTDKKEPVKKDSDKKGEKKDSNEANQKNAKGRASEKKNETAAKKTETGKKNEKDTKESTTKKNESQKKNEKKNTPSQTTKAQKKPEKKDSSVKKAPIPKKTPQGKKTPKKGNFVVTVCSDSEEETFVVKSEVSGETEPKKNGENAKKATPTAVKKAVSKTDAEKKVKEQTPKVPEAEKATEKNKSPAKKTVKEAPKKAADEAKATKKVTDETKRNATTAEETKTTEKIADESKTIEKIEDEIHQEESGVFGADCEVVDEVGDESVNEEEEEELEEEGEEEEEIEGEEVMEEDVIEEEDEENEAGNAEVEAEEEDSKEAIPADGEKENVEMTDEAEAEESDILGETDENVEETEEVDEVELLDETPDVETETEKMEEEPKETENVEEEPTKVEQVKPESPRNGDEPEPKDGTKQKVVEQGSGDSPAAEATEQADDVKEKTDHVKDKAAETKIEEAKAESENTTVDAENKEGDVVEKVAEKHVVEKVAEKPVVEKLAEKPVVEKVVEEPVVEKVVEEPVVEKVEEEPVVEKKVVKSKAVRGKGGRGRGIKRGMAIRGGKRGRGGGAAPGSPRRAAAKPAADK